MHPLIYQLELALSLKKWLMYVVRGLTGVANKDVLEGNIRQNNSSRDAKIEDPSCRRQNILCISLCSVETFYVLYLHFLIPGSALLDPKAVISIFRT